MVGGGLWRAAPTFSSMCGRVAFFTAGRKKRLPGRVKFWDRAGLKNRAGIGGVGVGGRGRRWSKGDRRASSETTGLCPYLRYDNRSFSIIQSMTRAAAVLTSLDADDLDSPCTTSFNF